MGYMGYKPARRVVVERPNNSTIYVDFMGVDGRLVDEYETNSWQHVAEVCQKWFEKGVLPK